MSSPPLPPQLQNPYGSKGMLRDLHMFFGRTDALRRVYAEIRDRQCLSLVGARRIGKSSLLSVLMLPELQKRLGYDLDHCLFAFIDLEERVQQTGEEFLGYVMKRLALHARGKLSLQVPAETSAAAFRDFLDDIVAEGFHPVLLLDEFDSITTNKAFDFSFFGFLRSQANAGKVSYITASKVSLDKVCHADIHGSPFFNLFSFYELGPLSLEEARDLILQPSTRAGTALSEDEIAWILQYGGRHPFFLQRVCFHLFEEKLLQPDAPRLHLVMKNVYDELVPHFNYTWEHLAVDLKELIQWEVRREEVAQRRLPAFSESRLFRDYVRAMYSADLTAITVDDLCNVMDELSDLRFLGESKLGYLNLVYQQIPAIESISVIEKGAIVDKLLQSAVETLRPQASTRKASENDLRLYNLLVWRHRDKIQNEEIAARLGIGLRHYYRERKRAAKALLEVLMKMETASKSQKSF